MPLLHAGEKLSVSPIRVPAERVGKQTAVGSCIRYEDGSRRKYLCRNRRRRYRRLLGRESQRDAEQIYRWAKENPLQAIHGTPWTALPVTETFPVTHAVSPQATRCRFIVL